MYICNILQSTIVFPVMPKLLQMWLGSTFNLASAFCHALNSFLKASLLLVRGDIHICHIRALLCQLSTVLAKYLRITTEMRPGLFCLTDGEVSIHRALIHYSGLLLSRIPRQKCTEEESCSLQNSQETQSERPGEEEAKNNIQLQAHTSMIHFVILDDTFQVSITFDNVMKLRTHQWISSLTKWEPSQTNQLLKVPPLNT